MTGPGRAVSFHVGGPGAPPGGIGPAPEPAADHLGSSDVTDRCFHAEAVPPACRGTMPPRRLDRMGPATTGNLFLIRGGPGA